MAVLLFLAGIAASAGCVLLLEYPLAHPHAADGENPGTGGNTAVVQGGSVGISPAQDVGKQPDSVPSDGAGKGGSPGDPDYHVYAGRDPESRIDGSDRAPRLVNNPDARDPSWEELASFLESDLTDRETYDVLTHACGVFAEELHNNAEARGIRAAYVDLGLAGEEVHHATNAFRTTNYGLIFIDDTGAGYQAVMPGREAPGSYDKICFVHEGDPYECLGIEGVSPSCDSSCYTRASQDLTSYNTMAESYNAQQEAYNLDVAQYNLDVSKQVYVVGTPEWYQINSRESDLRQRGMVLATMRSQLVDMKEDLVDMFIPLGTVRSIEIYW